MKNSNYAHNSNADENKPNTKHNPLTIPQNLLNLPKDQIDFKNSFK